MQTKHWRTFSNFLSGNNRTHLEPTDESKSCLSRVDGPHQTERFIMATKRNFGSVRQLGRNKFQASYKRKTNGVTRTFYAPSWFPSRTEANAWLSGEQNLVLEGKWTEPGTPNKLNTEMPTFEQFALRHIDLQTTSAGLGLRESVKVKYKSYINNQLAVFKGMPIDSITRTTVDEWWLKQRETGKLTTASKAYKFMHAVFERAADPDSGWVAVNPCKVKGAQNASTGRATTAVTIDELHLLAANINPRYKTMLYVATLGGFRFGELAALRIADFKLINDGAVAFYEVTVERQIQRLNGDWVLGATKTAAGEGAVRLNSSLTPMVSEHLDSLPDTESESLAFPSANGGYLHNGVLAKEMKLAAARCGLVDRSITPHSLRRGGATAYANTGVNIDEVKEFLRDSSAAAALRYVKSTNRKAVHIEAMMGPLA